MMTIDASHIDAQMRLNAKVSRLVADGNDV
jgi:hypothetical protein